MTMKKLIYLIMVVLSLTVTSISFGSPFQNGSFEIGPYPGSYITLIAGDTSITGWVTQGSIDYIGSYWTASDGSRSLDLNGYYTQGGISQTFDTVAGTLYNVSFDLAGNSDGPPVIKVLLVSGGSATSTYTFSDTGSNSNMGWVTESFMFYAQGPSSTITFTSITGDANYALSNSFGPALDNVNVNAVPEPTSLLLFGLGLIGLAGIRRKIK
jgi:choice-of-anchor C domain-containing protein